MQWQKWMMISVAIAGLLVALLGIHLGFLRAQ